MSFGAAKNKYLNYLTPAMEAPFESFFGLEDGHGDENGAEGEGPVMLWDDLELDWPMGNGWPRFAKSLVKKSDMRVGAVAQHLGFGPQLVDFR